MTDGVDMGKKTDTAVSWQDTAPDPLILLIDRSEIEAGDTANAEAFFSMLTRSEESIRFWFERVDLAFYGYDHVREELDEIPEVRDYVQKLDGVFPYWLYFLTKNGLGLQCVLHCHLPPFLTEAGRLEVHPPLVRQLLLGRWFPAMNTLWRGLGLPEALGVEVSERVFAYFAHGPLSSPRPSIQSGGNN